MFLDILFNHPTRSILSEYFIVVYSNIVKMVLIQACRQLSRDMLLALSKRRTCELQSSVRDVVTRLQLHRRGYRSGEHQLHHRMSTHIADIGCPHYSTWGNSDLHWKLTKRQQSAGPR